MKKPIFCFLCFLAILFLGGTVRAEDSAKSLLRVADQARFSRDRVAPKVTLEVNREIALEDHLKLHRAQRGGAHLSTRSNRKWLMITGIGTLIAGVTLMATSTEEVTGIDPNTGQPVTFKQTRRGRQLAGYSLMGVSGFFMYWASMQ